MDRLASVYEKLAGKFVLTSFECGGSEPTIHPQIQDVMNLVTRYGPASIPCNNSRHPKKWLPEAADRVFIRAALHPQGEEKFDKFLKYLLIAKDMGEVTSVIYVVHPERMDKVHEYRDLFEPHGIEFTPTPFQDVYQGRRYPQSYTKEEREFCGWTGVGGWYQMIYPQIRNRQFAGIPCVAGQQSLYIEPTGHLRRCLYDPKRIDGPAEKAKPCQVKHCGCGLLLEELSLLDERTWNCWRTRIGLSVLQHDSRSAEQVTKDNLAIYQRLMQERGRDPNATVASEH